MFERKSIVSVILLGMSVLSLVTWTLVTIRVQKNLYVRDLNVENTQLLINDAAFSFGALGVIIFNSENVIIWMNRYIYQLLQKKYVGKKISKLINLSDFGRINSNKTARIRIEGHLYEAKYVTEYNVILIRNKEIENSLATTNFDQSLGIGIVNLDNLNNNFINLPERDKIFISDNIYGQLIRWGEKNELFLKKTDADQYMIISNTRNLKKAIENNEFDEIIQEINTVFEEKNINSNISFGISFGLSEPDILHEEALECLEMATSRGGGQAVIRDCNKSDHIFIGGEKLGKLSFTGSDLKIFSRQLKTIIANKKRVLITGHKWADYDAIGSSLGIYHLCNDVYKKETKIILDSKMLDVQTFNYLKAQIPKNEYKKIYLKPTELSKYISRDTLLIVLDTNLKERTEVEEYVNEFADVVIIDHHNVSKDYISDATANYIDIYRSSTSEIVSEILNNLLLTSQIKKAPQWTLDILLSGIILDTNNFKVRVNKRTFFVSNLLLSWGANLDIANKLLENPYDETLIKNEIMATLLKIKEGVYIAHGKDDVKIDRAVIGLTAQEITEIKDVKASFVVCNDKNNNVYVSCRSISPDINVQLIAEKLGGGGSFNSSAIQFKNKTIQEVIDKISHEIKR